MEAHTPQPPARRSTVYETAMATGARHSLPSRVGAETQASGERRLCGGTADGAIFSKASDDVLTSYGRPLREITSVHTIAS